MLVAPRLSRVRPRIAWLGSLVFCLIIWSLLSGSRRAPRLLTKGAIQQRFPLAWKHIQLSDKKGGAWFIPKSWQGEHAEPQNIVEAAQLASETAKLVPYSNIPLIVHQKWNDNDLSRLNDQLLTYIETWLRYSISANDTYREMAYFWWVDSGVDMLVKEKEKGWVEDFHKLFSQVEKVDIFRILVCKWYGGIVCSTVLLLSWRLPVQSLDVQTSMANQGKQYGDVDTVPLQHPADWIREEDVSLWTDSVTGDTYGQEFQASDEQKTKDPPRPVNLLLGLEADTDPKSDRHWRMGYNFPVQLTNWAMASARQHPVLYRFMDRLRDQLKRESKEALQTSSGRQAKEHDPLTRTGPAAVTETAMTWLKKQVGLRWNALTGLKDGGRAKLASDVLVLPITGFR
ncbi:hypothetical protein UVI_02019530 [Ustilaginoidea virens]|uniref:Uncharacterized protein n=1 Tax=Ustilaginoidea virens TaxID=1159556 RepID=A0A1B5KZR9_USTVR|nr:hypothetical protein UVI_02019530 [Ustilaginoidea virens]